MKKSSSITLNFEESQNAGEVETLKSILSGVRLNSEVDSRVKRYSCNGLLEPIEVESRFAFLLAEISDIPVVLSQKISSTKSSKRKSDGCHDEKNVAENEREFERLKNLYLHDLTHNPWKIQSWFQLGLMYRCGL